MIGDRYVIEFNDGTDTTTVVVSDESDVSTSDRATLIVHRPGRRIHFPWHRISAVTFERTSGDR